MKYITWLGLLFASIFLSGCLTFKTVEYEIKVAKDLSAKGKVIFRGVGSDVTDADQRKLDAKSLIEHALLSNEFVKDRAAEGKKVTGRKLYEKDGLLVAEIEFSVKHVGEIEGVYLSDKYIYVDVDKDSKLESANGEITTYGGGQQILWKKGAGELKYSVSVYNDESFKPFSLLEEYKTYMNSKSKK